MTTPLGPFDENSPLGYYFHPSADPHQPGHPQVDIIIHSQPTDKYFDPAALTCTVAAADSTDTLRVVYPWSQSDTYRVCAGNVVIEDRRHKRVAAFTFGGELQIDSDTARILCHLKSPAPILENSTEQSLLDDALIDEVGILFAERRAARDEDTFMLRLVAAEPGALSGLRDGPACEIRTISAAQ